MTMYEFAKRLMNGAVSSPNATIEIVDDMNTEQFWDANTSRVDHSAKTVFLAAHLDYAGDDNWINTLNKLKDWTRRNRIQRGYKVVFENHDFEAFDNITVLRKNVLKLMD